MKKKIILKKMGGVVRIENILGGKYTKETVVRGELSIYTRARKYYLHRFIIKRSDADRRQIFGAQLFLSREGEGRHKTVLDLGTDRYL